MSYAIEVEGSQEAIGEAFDKVRDSSASYGMPEAEQHDIDELRDIAMQFASNYGRVKVSASGHFTSVSAHRDGTVSSFARASITITAAATPTT